VVDTAAIQSVGAAATRIARASGTGSGADSNIAPASADGNRLSARDLYVVHAAPRINDAGPQP
jgi:hypothetical protein